MISMEEYLQDNSSGFRGMWVISSGPEKGMIISYCRCSWDDVDFQVKEGCRLVYGYYRSDEYLIDDYDVAQPRPKITEDTEFEIKADGQDTLTIQNIPKGTEVLNEKRAIVGTVQDGIFEFDTTIPALYEFTLEPPFPHQIQKITVNAL